MSSDELLVERREGVLVVTLNRPDARNALTPSMLRGVGVAVAEAESDADIRVVVLTGAGDRAFCAGMDLRSFASGESFTADEAMQTFHRLLAGNVRVPVIGAANGTALAGGLELLLGCDLIVVADTAMLGLPEVKRGLFPGGNGTLLGNRIPLSIALEIALTGDNIDASRALAVGLVNAVVPADRVLEVAIGFAERIAANGPLAVATVKELVHLGITDRARWSQRRDELQPVVFGSEDAREGALAFIEKRAPVWKGR